MQSAPARDDEAAALAALHDLDVLDSAPEAEFDALVRVAALACDAPIALISLIDAERQWFKANQGLPGVTETPRATAFCAHAVLGNDLFEVVDATADPRFADNPLVTGEPKIAFYAGAPIQLRDGIRIGTICVIDHRPRQLKDMQRAVLSSLSGVVARALQGRRATQATIDALNEAARAKSAQAEAESFGFAILNAIDAPIAVLGRDGAITMVNQAWRHFARHNSAEPGSPAPRTDIGSNYLAICQQVDDAAHTGSAMQAFTGIQAVIDGRAPRFSLEYPCHSPAAQRWFTLNAAPLRAGGGAVISHVDITERVVATMVAEQATRDLQKILDEVPAMIGYWDHQLINRFANRAYQDWFGSEIGSLAGTHISQLLGEALYAKNLPFLEAVLRGEEQRFERTFKRPDGSGAIQALAHYLPDLRDGKVQGFYVLVFDVTELKRTQDALQESNVALQERSVLAEAASVAKGQFLANMSHEIRTPMNAVLGMLKLLRRTALTPRQADYAGKTETAARALLGLLNEVLDFSKIESGKLTLDPHTFCIDELLRDLSVILSANVGNKRLEVLFDIDPALPRHMLGDAMRLQQVLTNLAGNAIKFTAAGEVVLSMKVVQRSASEVTVDVAVRDTGIGIASENQARIFQGFTQAEASITRRYGGTGLGLSISQRLVALMGGRLEVDSELGVGSRFHFRMTLPVSTDPIEAQATSLAWPARVLLVNDNDNATARDVLARMVHALGWAVDTVDCSQGARDIWPPQASASMACDAVIVDCSSGRLRDGEVIGHPVVVLTTAYDLERQSERGPQGSESTHGVLIKPFTARMLRDAVTQVRTAEPHRPPAGDHDAADTQRLSGMRLLLAEDNILSQQVACGLLAYEGAQVQIAGNGQEALEMVERAVPRFDAVLMDLQMPLMDGFTATRRIRQLKAQRELTIVAMTANASPSDQEACMAAGMNDHVAKPIDIDELVRVLRKCAGQTGPAMHAVAACDMPLSQAVSDAAAAAGVDIQAALNRMGGKRQFYKRMLRDFVSTLASTPQQLRTCMATDEALSALHAVHNLHGLAATLGLEALSAMAARAEDLLATWTLTTVSPSVQSMPNAIVWSQEVVCAILSVCSAIEEAESGLSTLLQALEALPADELSVEATATDVDHRALSQDLRTLCDQLAQADMRATDSVDALVRRFSLPLGKRLQPLAEAVDRLDFALAQRLCQQMLKGESG